MHNHGKTEIVRPFIFKKNENDKTGSLRQDFMVFTVTISTIIEAGAP